MKKVRIFILSLFMFLIGICPFFLGGYSNLKSIYLLWLLPYLFLFIHLLNYFIFKKKIYNKIKAKFEDEEKIVFENKFDFMLQIFSPFLYGLILAIITLTFLNPSIKTAFFIPRDVVVSFYPVFVIILAALFLIYTLSLSSGKILYTNKRILYVWAFEKLRKIFGGKNVDEYYSNIIDMSLEKKYRIIILKFIFQSDDEKRPFALAFNDEYEEFRSTLASYMPFEKFNL